MDASVVSMAYLHMDMWVPLSEPPLKYVVGNASAKIEALKNEALDTDLLAAKMQTLCVAGYESEVESAIHLVRECSFTSILVEQAHASGAQLMHRHPQLETAALVSRMTVHNARTLFYPSYFQKQELRLNTLLQQVVKQMENTKFTQARQAYVKLLVDKCKAGRDQRGPSDHSIRRAIFKRHSDHFFQLSPGQLSVLRTKASAMVKKKIDGLVESQEHVQAQLRLLREREVESQALGVVNHIDSLRYGDAESARFSELFLESDSPEDLGKLQSSPQPVPAAMEAVLQAQMEKLDVHQGAKPDWLAALVNHRDQFDGVALYCDLTHPDAGVIFKYVLAVNNPQRVRFLECHRSRVSDPAELGLPDSGGLALQRFGHYQYNALRFVDHMSVPWKSMDEIWVLPDAHFQGSSVHTAAFPECWFIFTRYHKCLKPVAEGRTPSSHTRSRKPIDPEIMAALMAQFPWMTFAELEALLTTKAKAREGGGQSQPSSGSASSHVETVVTDNVFADVAADLEAMRQQWAGGVGGVEESYFNVRILGGEWSVSKFKTQAKDIGSYPKDKSTSLWCSAVGWPPPAGQKSFSVAKFGMMGARHLAEEMSRRGSYFMHAWVSAGAPAPFSFSPLLGGYKAPDDYTNWFEDLPVTSECCKAAMVIMDLCPNDMPV